MRDPIRSVAVPALATMAGIGMIEVLVSMVIGLVALLAITQVFAGFEASKRTTMAGVTAQTNGLLALRVLEKEVRQGGYGLSGNSALMCPIIKYYNAGSGITTLSSMPLKINDGGSAPDSIETFYSSSAVGAAPLHLTADMPTPSNKTSVNTVAGLSSCDLILMASPDGSKSCTLMQVTGTQSGNNVSSTFFQTSSADSYYNPPGGGNAGLFPTGGYNTNDVVMNMGNFINKRFVVSKTVGADEYFLRQVNLNTKYSGCGTQVPDPDLDLVSNVVDIQARYGVAAAGSQTVSCWTDAIDLTSVYGPDPRVTGANSSYCYGKDWSNPDTERKNRIKAVRVAVAVRSVLPEKPSVDGAGCDATAAAPVGWDGGPTMRIAAVANWQCYRYKVYQTIIPLINVIWAGT
jgi:type IV pilus assembly protein PilW